MHFPKPQFFDDQTSERATTKTMTKKRTWLLVRTYLPDWVVTIVLFGLFYLLDRVNGYRRSFDITDTSLHHTFAEHERITNKSLVLICFVAPLVIILFVSTVFLRSLWDLHSGWLGLILSLAVTSTATNIVKICVGRPRPDFLDRCQPPAGLSNPTPYTLSTWEICTRTDLLNDGFRSFPSGHSSGAFCGLIYLTLYLSGKMKIYNKRGLSIKTWILLIPVSGAVLVAVSRSMDYRHHATDIIAGSILGFFIGWYCYRQYYPALNHPLCHRPYSPRIARDPTDVAGDQHSELEGLGPNKPVHSSASGHSNGQAYDPELGHGNGNGQAGAATGLRSLREDGLGAGGGVPIGGGGVPLDGSAGRV